MRFPTLTSRLGEWHWKFAWTPTLVGDQWIWLERYRARYVDVGHLWSEYRWQRVMTEEEQW